MPHEFAIVDDAGCIGDPGPAIGHHPVRELALFDFRKARGAEIEGDFPPALAFDAARQARPALVFRIQRKLHEAGRGHVGARIVERDLVL